MGEKEISSCKKLAAFFDLISYSFNLLHEIAGGNVQLFSERLTWGLLELFNCSTDQMWEETLCLTLILLKWAMNLRNGLQSNWLAKTSLTENNCCSFSKKTHTFKTASFKNFLSLFNICCFSLLWNIIMQNPSVNRLCT